MTQIIPPEILQRMVVLRRDLHRHPELGWEEERTGARIVAELEELGLKARRMAGTGVVADIRGAHDGPRIALRADMDALPIHEETGLEFASAHEGVMHACGHAGTAPNVIADAAVLEGTIRALEDAVRAHLQEAIKRITFAIGQLHGAKIDVNIAHGMPPVINTPEMTELAHAAASDVVGADRVVPLHTANMGGEDFAWYLDHVKGCYIRVGAQVSGLEGYPAHSSRFDFDEQALATGAAWFARIARLAGARSSAIR